MSISYMEDNLWAWLVMSHAHKINPMFELCSYHDNGFIIDCRVNFSEPLPKYEANQIDVLRHLWPSISQTAKRTSQNHFQNMKEIRLMYSDISDYRFHRHTGWIHYIFVWTNILELQITNYDQIHGGPPLEASWIGILITCDCERYIIYAWVYIWEGNYNILPIQNILFIWFEYRQHCNDPLTFIGNCL